MIITTTQKHCVPCEIPTPPLIGKEVALRLKALPRWGSVGDHHLQKKFSFPDFKSALEFVNKIGELAEQEGHHPDIELAFGKVIIKIFTHAVKGLTENDFILAELIESLEQNRTGEA